jgi:Metallo-peptidase family M12
MPDATSTRSLAHRARSIALLLAAAAWSVATPAASGLVPQHTEDLRASLTPASSGGATLSFTAFGRDFRLRLSANERLARLAAGSGVQLYKGAIEGVPDSWARISLVDGLPRGMIWDGHELLVLDAGAEAVNYGAAGTVLYKLSDAVLEQGASFVGDAVEKPDDPAVAYDAMIGELRTRAHALQAGVATEGVAISILGDAAFLARYSSEAQARAAVLTRLNSVDGIFSSQVGVELQVVSVNLGDELTASLSATTDPSARLEALAQVRQQHVELSATGLTHLFTGRALSGQTTGIAYTHALCSKRFGASLTVAHDSAALDTLITAHEIGHVFGAPHDGAQQCASTPQDQFIMTPTFHGTSVTSFSQCSLDQIDAVIDSYACIVELPPPDPEPDPPPPPTTPPEDGGSSGGGGSGGGGSLDPAALLMLLAISALRLRRGGRDRRQR